MGVFLHALLERPPTKMRRSRGVEAHRGRGSFWHFWGELCGPARPRRPLLRTWGGSRRWLGGADPGHKGIVGADGAD